jgi:hypothetical protein
MAKTTQHPTNRRCLYFRRTVDSHLSHSTAMRCSSVQEFALDLNSLTKNALLALGAACAVMAVLIVVASIFPISGHLRVLVQLIG